MEISHDAGLTWKRPLGVNPATARISAPQPLSQIKAIRFATGLDGWILDFYNDFYNFVWATPDGGDSWTQLAITNCDPAPKCIYNDQP